MILQHYKAPSTLGQKCTATLEALQVEIGCTGNPLLECYHTRGILATPCWISSVWERCWQYKLMIYLNYDELLVPRKNGITIISLLLQHNVRGMDLRRMNRCRLTLNAIFLSDIITANGKLIEEGVYTNRIGRTSKIRFPREQPCSTDWELWDNFWSSWTLRNNTIPSPLGSWINKSHQDWHWFINTSTNTLWECTVDGWLMYGFTQNGNNTRSNQTYTPLQLWQDIQLDKCAPVSVRKNGGLVQICNIGPPHQHPKIVRGSVWEFVMQHGGTWMWDFIEGKKNRHVMDCASLARQISHNGN